MYKSWEPKGFFQFEIIINVLVSSFWSIWIPMLWFYDHYKYFISFSAGTVLIRQNLTSTDVRFWRINTVPALQGLIKLRKYNHRKTMVYLISRQGLRYMFCTFCYIEYVTVVTISSIICYYIITVRACCRHVNWLLSLASDSECMNAYNVWTADFVINVIRWGWYSDSVIGWTCMYFIISQSWNHSRRFVLKLALILLVTTIVVFNLFYQSIKSLFWEIKCVVKQQNWQIRVLKLNKYE